MIYKYYVIYVTKIKNKRFLQNFFDIFDDIIAEMCKVTTFLSAHFRAGFKFNVGFLRLLLKNILLI